MDDFILLRGAKEHNLKNIDLKIPKNKIICITGLSGSGKSSLAFDTIYAEGQRRYVESLSSYARQFLQQLQKPDLEHIEGLSPSIAIEQRTTSGSLRSIVATQTEIYDYLRLLFARIGRSHCCICQKPIRQQTSQEIIDKVFLLPQTHKIFILSPVVRGKKGQYLNLFLKLSKQGFTRIRVDGKLYELSDQIKLYKNKIHNIEIVVDRIKISGSSSKRIADSVETALSHSEGLCLIWNNDTGDEFLFNTKFSCSNCGISYEEIEPRMFSFNSPYGACSACNGLGIKLEFDPDLIIPDTSKSLREGAIEAWRRGGKGYIMYYRAFLRELAKAIDFSMDIPFKRLPKKIKSNILYGDPNVYVWNKPFEGVIPHLERIFNTTDSEYRKTEIAKYMSKLSCPECSGSRLKKESLAVYVNNKSIWDVVNMNINSCFVFFDKLKLSKYEDKIANHIIKEIKKRLIFCRNVGLSYLCLDRLSSTLSGGESQRIRLATQVGSSLSGVIYILDEPTIGLHPKDDKKLIRTLENLRDLGNTVIIVEHDEQMIHASDWIVDLGPGAGVNGGKVLYSGSKDNFLSKSTLTAKYLRSEKVIAIPERRRSYNDKPCLNVRGASEHNLREIDIVIPLEVFVCVTGVSGSGKSTLVEDIVYNSLAKRIYGSRLKVGKFNSIEGLNNIDKVIIVDQSPIGRTSRSNPATYVGVFTYIRDAFSRLPETKARGYKLSRFSFNVAGGRCEACRGEGTKRIEMHFLPDIYVPCRVCSGKRFNKQTLEVRFKGKNISDVLNMNVDEAYEVFINFPSIKNILQTLKDVGLGYITLGQSATTLSGGEAQRIKLASQLRKRATGKTLYLLDEPTTGLHFEDVSKLLLVLQRLVEKKNTILVIEHNLDVIKCADYIIDLGPGGGDDGGRLVACGSPEEIALDPSSCTGKFLKSKLNKKVGLKR